MITILLLHVFCLQMFVSSSIAATKPSMGLRNVSSTATLAVALKEAQGFLKEVGRQKKNPKNYNWNIINMMKQCMYLATERLWPLEPIVAKYENSTAFRMAYIFMQLDQLTNEGHAILRYIDAVKRKQVPYISAHQWLQVHWQLVRRNVDVTYLVDFIIDRVPHDNVKVLRQWVARKEKEDLERKLLRKKKTG